MSARHRAFAKWVRETHRTDKHGTPVLVSRTAFVAGYDAGYERCRQDLAAYLERLELAEAETTALVNPRSDRLRTSTDQGSVGEGDLDPLADRGAVDA